jgi:hypothetical protein
MKKIILIFLFAIYSAFSFSQDTSAVIIQDQAIKYTNFQLFSDSVRFSGIGGSGSVLRITEDGWVYVDVGTQDTLIDTSQVVNLNKYLNLKQNIIYGADSITIRNDSIFWNGVSVNGVTGLIDSLNAKQDNIIAGNYISFSENTINVTNIPVTYITGALDSINTRQRTLTAGTGITISNDTISSTATGADGDWTINGNYVYNLSDSIGIGVSDPSVALEINGRAKITNIQTGLTVTNTGASTALNLISNVAGSALTINSGVIDSLSNDATLSGNDANDIVSEQAVKGYVDNRILNDTRVSWAADVDTSTRVDGFVLKWNNGTKNHYYDTAGAGGGGGTYFAGAGLQLAANVFSIANDGVETSMIQNDAVTYSKIQNVGGNSILARTASGSGTLSEVSLSANRLLGRGNTGNVSAISLNGLNMLGNVLTNPYTGTVTNIASGNGMSFSSITTTGTIAMGTPTTLTGTTTNSVGVGTHAHALDFTTFQSNTRTFYLDTARVVEEFLSDGKLPITNQEKVIAFTLSRNADSVRLRAGYYTMHGMVDIEVTNDDTTAGVAGFFQNYQLNAFVTEATQALGRGLSGTTTVLETAEANATPISSTDNHGDPKDGTIRLHLVTTPIKFYLDGTQFVALTIKATYPSPTDFVSHKRATMIINRVVDFDGRDEQTPDITEE